MKRFTVGQIFKHGLLQGKSGVYRSKDQVLRAVRTLKYKKIRTRWGMSYSVPLSEIERHNASRQRKTSVRLISEEVDPLEEVENDGEDQYDPNEGRERLSHRNVLQEPEDQSEYRKKNDE